MNPSSSPRRRVTTSFPFWAPSWSTNRHILRMCTLNRQILASCYITNHVDTRYKRRLYNYKKLCWHVHFHFHPIGVTSLKNVIARYDCFLDLNILPNLSILLFHILLPPKHWINLLPYRLLSLIYTSKFSLTNFSWQCKWTNMTSFSLTITLVQKLVC